MRRSCSWRNIPVFTAAAPLCGSRSAAAAYRGLFGVVSLACLTLSLGGCPGAVGTTPTISPTELPNGITTQAYSQTLTSTVDDTTFTVTAGALPPGLRLGASGVLDGTPTEAGSFTFTVEARNGAAAASATYTVVIAEQLTLTVEFPSPQVDVPLSGQLVATGGTPPYGFAAVGLPAGVMLDPEFGSISGIPLTASAGIPLVFTVVDSAEAQQAVTRSATLVVRPRPVAINTMTLPAGRNGETYEVAIEALDGTAPFSWSIQTPGGGLLPNGLRLDASTGVISGTISIPQTPTDFTFTVRVEDSDTPSNVDTQQLLISVPN